MNIQSVAMLDTDEYHVKYDNGREKTCTVVIDDLKEWIDEGNTPEPYVEPEPSWIDKRLANMADGGYGSIGEQLDMLYWDKKNGTDNWEKHIDKVKSDIPKA